MCHAVRKESDVTDENNVFKPDMSHQLFGDRSVPYTLLPAMKSAILGGS